MAELSLQKPLGTDIYDIAVFNNNATAIETAVNQHESTISQLGIDLSLKYNIFTNPTSIDTKLDDGIYYLKIKPATATYPSNIPSTINNILISLTNSTTNIQYLFSEEKIYKRTVTTSPGNWVELTTAIINNLTTNSSTSALSATQGKILNDSKLPIHYYKDSAVDLNTLVEEIKGVNICTNCTAEGTIPEGSGLTSSSTFILECFYDNTIVLQRLTNIVGDNSTTYYRTSNDNGVTWADWKVFGVGGGGGTTSGISSTSVLNLELSVIE